MAISEKPPSFYRIAVFMLNKITKEILNIIFPIECAGCGKEDVWLCADCLEKIAWRENNACPFCGKTSTMGATCSACRGKHSLEGILVAADYSDHRVENLIKKLKYSFARESADAIGEIICRQWKKAANSGKGDKLVWREAVVAPIPLHKKRYNWRGFNQAALIAEYFATHLNLPYRELITRQKYQTPQAKLSGAERQKNLSGCFAISRENVMDKKIILVDDVATTGSTLDEAAKTLKEAGAAEVWAIVAARG
jgi:competence protein ComFC